MPGVWTELEIEVIGDHYNVRMGGVRVTSFMRELLRCERGESRRERGLPRPGRLEPPRVCRVIRIAECANRLRHLTRN